MVILKTRSHVLTYGHNMRHSLHKLQPTQGGPSDVADRAGAAAGGHAAAGDAGAVLRHGRRDGRAPGQGGLPQAQPRKDIQVKYGPEKNAG